jgi:hypothetical protein
VGIYLKEVNYKMKKALKLSASLVLALGLVVFPLVSDSTQAETTTTASTSDPGGGTP